LDVGLTTCCGKNIVTKSKESMVGLSEGQLAEVSEEGLGSKGAVVPMMMVIMMHLTTWSSEDLSCVL